MHEQIKGDAKGENTLPVHAIHRQLERLSLGRTFPKIHSILDVPSFFGWSKILHDPLFASIIGFHLYGEQGIYSALLHVDLDRLCTEILDSPLDIGIDYTIYL